jgi:hypothetical protein
LTRQKDGRLVFVAGRSGMGKTSLVRELIQKENRLLIYDPKGAARDFVRCHTVGSIRSLTNTIGKLKEGNGRYRFIDDSATNFDTFCRLVNWWSRFGPCAVVVDELADVTSPGKAPKYWGMLIRKGRSRSINRYACTQRPAESDKTSIGNADELITFHMKRINDRKAMALEMDIDVALITRLKPFEYLSDAPGRNMTRPQKTKK